MATSGSCDATQTSFLTTLFNSDAALVDSVCLYLGTDANAAAAAVQVSLDTYKQDLGYGVNQGWLVLCGALVLIMHGGFAMLCAGAIRSKNAMNILLQTILDACVSAIGFYCVGFAFAYGEGDRPNPVIGDALFGLARLESHFTPSSTPGATYETYARDGKWADFFYQWAFAATATTIPAGCVAERFNFNAYLGYTWWIACWVYPLVVHWAWSRQGWMTFIGLPPGASLDPPVGRTTFMVGGKDGCGFIDFAGSGVVHMVGGACGLTACVLVGPRLGRFDASGKPVNLPGHSAILVVLGTILLWFGWYGFNPGSYFGIDSAVGGIVSARAAVTTTLSGAAGGLTALVIGFLFKKSWDVVGVCNGVLVGFVAITAGAHVLEPWAAICDGIWGVFWFELACRLWLKLKIDDPLSAAPMHMVGGAAGLIWVGLLAKMDYVYQAYGRAPFWGLFYRGGGYLLACQVIGILVIFGWCVVNMTVFLLPFKLLGHLRIPVDEEQRGLDASKHGGSAYNGEEVAAQMLRLANGGSGHKIAPEPDTFGQA